MTEVGFELWQNDRIVATTEGTLAEAASSILYHATLYQKAGPIEIKRVTRETMTAEQVTVLAFNSWVPSGKPAERHGE